MLSVKQQVFVEEYLHCWNATQAAKRAGYSAKTARSIGSENLTKPDIRAAIQARLGDLKLSANEVLARLSEQARGSIQPFVKITPDGLVRFDFSNPEALDHLYLIKKIRTKRRHKVQGHGKGAETWEYETIDVELYNAQAALFMLGKYHKLFTDRVEMDNRLNIVGLEEMLDKVYGKAKSKG